MPSPFPGMDPYLEEESLWPTFQHQLVLSLYQILLPGLVDRYRARIAQRQYVTEQALFTSIIREEHQEDYIEIRQRNDGRLVTLIDVVSPANKITAAGRSAYLEKRKESRNVSANLVELDLVLQGEPTLDYSRDGLPDWDYAVTVTRSTQPERYEIYTATLQKRLPRFRLPLAADDRDTVLDLHTVFSRCYDQGGFAARIDYQKDPVTALHAEDRQWLQELLRQAKLR
jgi:predicted transcriptional regulator